MTASSATVARSAEDRQVSQEVIYALAEASEKDPTEMAPLHDVVDLDALDQLFQARGDRVTTARVEFVVDGYEVTISAGGDVSVTPTEA